MSPPLPPATLEALAAVVGPAGLLTDPADTAPHCRDWFGEHAGQTPAVVRPGNTAEVAAVVRLLGAQGVAIVPQGGNTGLAGGGTPDGSGRQVVLSLARMNRVRAVDPVDMTLTVEAGAPWQRAQEAADAAGCLLPLSISSEGTAQVGGILATNAGGNTTVRYGSARELTLGLEVVLADGQVWDGLRHLRKDNTGYGLRHLFVGAEGTLGIITAAVLRLAPRPTERAAALCALPSPAAALELFRRVQGGHAAALHAFEYMSAAGVELVLRLVPGAALPLAAPAPHYALVELATADAGAGLRAGLERTLEAALGDGVALDAVLAESEAQRRALWRLREDQAEAQRLAGASVKCDVSVPVSRTAELIERTAAACERVMPGLISAPFGHMGDGNIHVNLVQPPGADSAAFRARVPAIREAVNAVVRELGGSFSAEHGIGRNKLGLMEAWRGGAELDAMRRIKRALDPAGLLNPGKVLPD